MARVFVLVVCAMALAACSGLKYVQVAPQTANGRKSVQPKSAMPMPPPAVSRNRMVSQEALLIPQPEASCKPTDSSLDERQKLDYERQCYRHAEMIVRARLELLQSSINRTINAVRSSGRIEP